MEGRQIDLLKNVSRKSDCHCVPSFGWQTGYGAFSVSESVRESVFSYIAQQEMHHRRISFQDEFRAILNKHRVRFEERYLWE
jgi:putative transposase